VEKDEENKTHEHSQQRIGDLGRPSGQMRLRNFDSCQDYRYEGDCLPGAHSRGVE
jgi:hypothetical protein